MKNPPTTTPSASTFSPILPFYYGWINVVVASVAMTATLPGRTHGLGLITEPLLQTLRMDPVLFARLNLISTLIGASFCIPIGWMIDRRGVRMLISFVTLALGLSVVAMSHVTGPISLLLCLILVRGFGQSALSLVSIAVIGKWFQRRLGMAMGVFAVLLTFGFIGSVLVMGSTIEQLGWSVAWRSLGWVLIALAPVFWLCTRDRPTTDEQSIEQVKMKPARGSMDVMAEDLEAVEESTWTVRQAISSPGFWILVAGCSSFNLVWSGVTLFNESIMRERGLDQAMSVEIMAILTGLGLLANLICGGLATRERILKLLSVGLALLAIGMALFWLFEGIMAARLYAISIGLSGGIITIVFFAAWRHLFGESELGRIQGVAQLGTVLASAIGPVLMAGCFQRFSTYQPVFVGLIIVTGVLSVAAAVIKSPTRSYE